MDNRFLEGASIIGIFKEPGLPNIKGYSDWWEEMGTNAHGVFEAYFNGTNTGRNARVSSSTGGNVQFNFDASRYNPIYGASDTVQPKSYTVYFIMKIK